MAKKDKTNISFTEEEKELFKLLKEQRQLPNFNPTAHRRYVEQLMQIYRPNLWKQVLAIKAGKSSAQIAREQKMHVTSSKAKSQRALKWLKAALIDPLFNSKVDS